MFGGEIYSDSALLFINKRNCLPLYLIPQPLQYHWKIPEKIMSENPTLYWNIVSQPSRAVKALLDIGKIPCKYVQIDLFKLEQTRPAFRAINPMGTVPTLVHGKLVVTESVAILAYLCEKYDSIPRSYFGTNAEERACINQYLSWCQSYLRPNLGALFFLQKDKGLRKRQVLLAQQIFVAQSKITQALSLLNQLLQNKLYLATETPTIADIMIYFEVTILAYHARDHYQYPNIDRWFKRVYAIPEVKMMTHQWFAVAQQMAKLLEQLPVKRASL